MGHVYVLRLENEKFYVGYSKNNDPQRILSHINHGKRNPISPSGRRKYRGAKWTQLHPPVKENYLYYWSKSGDLTLVDEDIKTLKMMVRYGIDNVRGGKWCMLEFSKISRNIIESRIKNLGNTDYIPKSNIKIKIQCSGWRMSKGRQCRRTVENEGDFCEDCKSQSQLGSLNDYINATEEE